MCIIPKLHLERTKRSSTSDPDQEDENEETQINLSYPHPPTSRPKSKARINKVHHAHPTSSQSPRLSDPPRDNRSNHQNNLDRLTIRVKSQLFYRYPLNERRIISSITPKNRNPRDLSYRPPPPGQATDASS